MVRWRFCVLLTVLLLLPLEIGSESDEADEEESEEGDDNNESDNGDEDEEEDVPKIKPEGIGAGIGIGARRTPPILLQTTHTVPVRTTKKRPLECYVCAHKPDTLLRACLDPTKFRVHTMTCHNVDDKCFTSVVSKGSSFEAVVRGCRSGCIGSPEITCCELNRCNSQAFAMPTMVEPQALVRNSSSAKTFPSSVLFFVTILLVLQTVVKVTFV